MTARALLVVLAAVMLAGCASRGPAVFQIDTRPADDRPRLIWPPASDREVARYVYLGALYGEDNFVAAEPEGNALFKALGGLFDLIAGDAPPRRLDRPQSGVVDEKGRILVTDIGRGAVFVFDASLGRLDIWDRADGFRGFVAPVGITLGPAGEALVADADLGVVARLDRDGNPLAPIGKGELRRPNGVAYDAASGRLFVVDTQAHQIKVFDLEGKLLQTWGERGEGDGQFNYPTHIALGGGKLYVSDTLNARVQILSANDGKHLRTIGRRGLFVGEMVRPKGVAVDSEQNTYIVESYFDHLLMYDAKGRFLMPIGGVGNTPGRFHLPAGVWVDARNRIFVADLLNGRVSVFQFLGGGAESE